jgi:hypothetical protein
MTFISCWMTLAVSAGLGVRPTKLAQAGAFCLRGLVVLVELRDAAFPINRPRG